MVVNKLKPRGVFDDEDIFLLRLIGIAMVDVLFRCMAEERNQQVLFFSRATRFVVRSRCENATRTYFHDNSDSDALRVGATLEYEAGVAAAEDPERQLGDPGFV